MFLELKKYISVFVFMFFAFAGFCFAQEAIPSAPVAPFGKELFKVYGNLGGSDALKRAATIENNIQILKKSDEYNPEEFKIVQNDGLYEIVYGSKTIMGITDKQSQAEGKEKAVLAQEYLSVVQSSLYKARKTSSRLLILRHILFSAFIIAGAYFAVKYIIILFGYLKVLVRRQKNKADKALNSAFDLSGHEKLLLIFIEILKFAAVGAVIFFCFLIFLSMFPITYKIAITIGLMLLNPLKTVALAVWNYLPNLIMIIIIAASFRLLSKILNFIASRIESGSLTINGFRPDWARTTYHLALVILFVFTLIFIFPFLPNSNSAVFKGISVFLGILISLGSTSLLNNLMSGLVITYMSPFKIGDRIKMGENIGNVVEKTALVTRVKTTKNELITIPNSVILSANTINYTASAESYGLILHASLTMGYEAPWRKVHEALISAALKTPSVLKEPAPFVLQTALDDFYVRYEINVYTDKANEMPKIYSDLYKNIQDVFHESGFELASPHITALRDGSTMFMPSQYNPKKVSEFSVSVNGEAKTSSAK